jgi:2-polyprenyl-3-methyl-5-hydroxy-6-metoxy-1,4-benzoquinol methylase
MTKRYYFENIPTCEMCGDNSDAHKILGQRLNRSQGLTPKRKDGISVSVKKCNRCGLIYSSPQPIPFNIQDHYGLSPDLYWKSSYFEIDENYFKIEITEAKELLGSIVVQKALDVGAGLGKAMISMEKDGIDTYGFEPSIQFYEKAITEMGISAEKLKLGTIEDIDYPANSFDFITYGAVLEHLYHPAACIEKTIRWLKPGGIIHIEVPSARWLVSLMVNAYYRLIGTNYVTNLSPMHVPFHLYEFDLCSFQALGSRLGFEVVRFRYDVCQIPYIPSYLQPLFRKLMKKTNRGMQLIVYLKKI